MNRIARIPILLCAVLAWTAPTASAFVGFAPGELLTPFAGSSEVAKAQDVNMETSPAGVRLLAWSFHGPLRVIRSTDRGASWSTPVLVSSVAASEHELASLGGSRWAIAWRRGTSTGIAEIRTAFSTDDGETWSEPFVHLSRFPGENHDSTPRLAWAGGDNVVLFYESSRTVRGSLAEHRIVAARSSDGGATWTYAPEFQFDGTSVPNARNPLQDMDCHPGGVCIVIEGTCTGSCNLQDFHRSLDAGATWLAEQAISQRAVKIEGAATGTWLAIGNDLTVIRSTDDGATWSPASGIDGLDETRAQSASDYALGTDGSGRWVILWNSEAAGSKPWRGPNLMWTRSQDDGLSWTARTTFSSDGRHKTSEGDNPNISVDGNGNWLAAWHHDGDVNVSTPQCWDCSAGAGACVPDDGAECATDDACVETAVCGAGSCVEETAQVTHPLCRWHLLVADRRDPEVGLLRTRSLRRAGSANGMRGDTCIGRGKLGRDTGISGHLIARQTERTAITFSPDTSVRDHVITGGGPAMGAGGAQLPGRVSGPIATGNVVTKTLTAESFPDSVYDTTGVHPLVAACGQAAGDLEPLAEFLETLPATQVLGPIRVAAGETFQLDPAVPGGLNIIDVPLVDVGSNARLLLDSGGSADTQYILRVEGGIRFRRRATVDLLNPSAALWYTPSRVCRIDSEVKGEGTLFCSNAKIRVARDVDWAGSIATLAGRLKLGTGFEARGIGLRIDLP